MTFRLQIVVTCLVTALSFSQNKEQYLSLTIDPQISRSSNAVVRYEKISVDIQSVEKIIVKTHRIVTILNKEGNRHRNAVEFYSDDSEIQEIEAVLYNSLGQEIKRIKERDFRDESAVSDFSIYEDDRVKFLDYIPLEYPYTLDYKSEVAYSNTAFFPGWMPINNYYLGVEHAEFVILNKANLELKLKKENFEQFDVQTISDFHFVIQNIKGIPYEAYGPSLRETLPKLKGALTEFSMIGIPGKNNDWKEFGKWMHDQLLTGTEAVPQSTKEDVIRLTQGIDSNLEKARIVYQYIQDRTRYISIQIGIGGWKPMSAMEVDQLGYGDCKGLTNYTKSLMEIAGVDAYYTVVYGGKEIIDLDSEFSSLQGNHVILTLPTDGEPIFLECTSQTAPFGFVAGFTDDRDALMVTPEGGEIVHTKIYGPKESYLKTNSVLNMDASGGLSGHVNLKSKGHFYGLRYSLENEDLRDVKLAYKKEWSYLNSLTIRSVDFSNDMELAEFNENISIDAGNYAKKVGDRFLLQPNIFNRKSYIPPVYENRQSKFEIARSYEEIDEYIISFPRHLEVEATSENVKIVTKFGSYFSSVEVLEGHKIKYRRQLMTNKGLFDPSEYAAYRDFRKLIVKSDKSKIVLKKI
jgi:hypothetical protein